MPGIDTGLMTRMLDKLETRGLLARTRSIDDRRVVNLLLTDKGQEVAEQIPGIASGVLNARLRPFASEQFEEFRRPLIPFSNAGKAHRSRAGAVRPPRLRTRPVVAR